MELNNKYSCKYIDGGGTEYDGGIWVKKESPKIITFTCIEESYFPVNWSKFSILKGKEKKNKHVMIEFDDATVTLYPFQCGTPHIFEPIKQ